MESEGHVLASYLQLLLSDLKFAFAVKGFAPREEVCFSDIDTFD